MVINYHKIVKIMVTGVSLQIEKIRLFWLIKQSLGVIWTVSIIPTFEFCFTVKASVKNSLIYRLPNQSLGVTLLHLSIGQVSVSFFFFNQFFVVPLRCWRFLLLRVWQLATERVVTPHATTIRRTQALEILFTSTKLNSASLSLT